MKALGAVAVVGLALMGTAVAQPYGGRDDGYRDRGTRYDFRDDRDYRDRDYRDRGSRYGEGGRYGGERAYDDRGRGRAERGRDVVGFDEREYLRCNVDVRRAVERGQMPSGAVHFRTFGRKEGRRLTC